MYGEAVLVGEGLDGLLGSEVLACGDVVDGVVGEEGCQGLGLLVTSLG